MIVYTEASNLATRMLRIVRTMPVNLKLANIQNTPICPTSKIHRLETTILNMTKAASTRATVFSIKLQTITIKALIC